MCCRYLLIVFIPIPFKNGPLCAHAFIFIVQKFKQFFVVNFCIWDAFLSFWNYQNSFLTLMLVVPTFYVLRIRKHFCWKWAMNAPKIYFCHNMVLSICGIPLEARIPGAPPHRCISLCSVCLAVRTGRKTGHFGNFEVTFLTTQFFWVSKLYQELEFGMYH